jgi:hypothetical protein
VWGYTLGHWTEQDVEEANLALKGDYFAVGEKAARGREKTR